MIVAGLPDGHPVQVGKRPESVTIAADGMAARVKVVEPTGSETFAVLDLGGQDLVCVFRERVSLSDGETINISLSRGETYFFDPAGVRLA